MLLQETWQVLFENRNLQNIKQGQVTIMQHGLPLFFIELDVLSA